MAHVVDKMSAAMRTLIGETAAGPPPPLAPGFWVKGQCRLVIYKKKRMEKRSLKLSAPAAFHF